MLDFRCPSCQYVSTAPTSKLGTFAVCPRCGAKLPLETENLARFSFPSVLEVEVSLPRGGPFRDCPVLISYGCRFPPLRTDSAGRVRVTHALFQKAMEDELSSGLMDHKGDYSLHRFLCVRVPSQSDAAALAEARRRSGWPIRKYEQELYKTLNSLLAAYIPPLDIESEERTLDLATHREGEPVELSVSVRQIAP